ncbi:MAG TPA: methyltransferase domain-containing protein [Solirubrobacteraceae bacterium]
MSPGEGGAVEAHYALGDLAQRILDALRRAGLNPDQLSPDDLAPVDEFHVRGREATEELAELAGLVGGQRVLDVGCGLGGTARHLADRYGVEVTGVDLTAEYCRLGNMLSERTRLRDRVELVTADALELPFADGGFDVVWSEHAAMNIEDKPRLYSEMRRVLRPGGRLAIYDILQGPGGEVHFPVPWARRPQISFLVSPAELRELLERCSFNVLAWQDTTAPAVSWFRARARALQADRTPALGFHLLLGSDAKEIFANQSRNLEEDRINLVQIVAEAA